MGPRNDSWAARFLVERARIRIYEGRSPEAVTLLTPGLPVAAAPDTVVRRFVILAMAQARTGNPTGALRSLDIAEGLKPEGAVASELYGFRGSVALERGHLDEAERMFRKALELAEHSGDKFQQTQMFMNLGVVALKQQHFEDALDGFQRASVIASGIDAKLSLQFALGNLGSVYYQTGDFLRALDTSRRAAQQASTMGATLVEAEALRNAGLSAFRLDDSATARSLFERSLALGEKVRSADKLFGAHQALGYLLLQTDPTLAATHIHAATALAAERKNPGDILEQEFAEALLLARQGHVQAAMSALRTFDAKASSVPSMQWEAESNLARLEEQSGDEKQSSRWYLRALATFRRQRRSLRTVELELPFLGNANDLYFGYVDHLIRQHKTDAALDLLDRSRAETLADGLNLNRDRRSAAQPTATSPRTLAAHLDATILIYSLRPGASYLWSVTPAHEDFYRLPGKEALLPLIRRHNQAILNSEDLLNASQTTSRALYDALVAPAIPTQPQPGSRVILIADEELNDLNFETLIPPTGPPHYWIQDVTITNARSLRLLEAASTTQSAAPKGSLLLIGDPVYTSTGYPELPNAALELNRIDRHFASAAHTVFQGSQAVPGAYVASKPGEFSYIHFVAHATSNETNPLDSAIVLSQPPSQPFAYRLYARDILNQPLHAELVTLSACYGSGRRNYSGEGLVGLAWAFLHAGAHNVIGALWQVNDASTPQLMDRLYTGLLTGIPPDAALRDAKLATIQAGGAFRKPLYWAPFQLYSGS